MSRAEMESIQIATIGVATTQGLYQMKLTLDLVSLQGPRDLHRAMKL